jgi:hypothetical protein
MNIPWHDLLLSTTSRLPLICSSSSSVSTRAGRSGCWSISHSASDSFLISTPSFFLMRAALRCCMIQALFPFLVPYFWRSTAVSTVRRCQRHRCVCGTVKAIPVEEIVCAEALRSEDFLEECDERNLMVAAAALCDEDLFALLRLLATFSAIVCTQLTVDDILRCQSRV